MFEKSLNLNESSNIMMLPSEYENINQMYFAPQEDLQNLFNMGRCHIYALALQNFIPEMELQAIYRDDIIQHVYCIDPEDETIMDSTGTYESVEEYMNADAINRFLMVEHKPVTLNEINKFIDEGILIPSSLESIELAEKTIALMKQI